MRVLIGFNGSIASRDALEDLKHAGLPDGSDIHVLTIAESWLSPKTLNEARLVSEEGASTVSNGFKTCNVSSGAAEGSPSSEILSAVETFKPDLLILGEPPQQADHHNMFLGQTSQIVLTESSCSVRIARKDVRENNGQDRLIIGFNGSPAAMLAVDSVVSRSWQPTAEVKLLAVADSSVLGSIGRFTPQMTDAVIEEKFAHQWAETLADVALEKLKKVGVRASLQIEFGHPKEIIAREAERWKANSIFVGPHCSLNSSQRFLIGSVSTSLAARANCSVEIVRHSPTRF